MPSRATLASSEVVLARARLRQLMARHQITQVALAKEAGVPQYAISRLLSGRTKSLTADAKRVLDYAISGIDDYPVALLANARLRMALVGAWDGTEAGAERLAETIEILALGAQVLRAPAGGTSDGERSPTRGG